MIPAIAVALALWTFGHPVAPHPLVGVWKITYPWHLEVENGVVKPTMETGELKVEARGDSLIASLETSPSPQFPNRRPLRLAAPLGTGDAVFVTRDKVTLTMGGTAREATAVSTWILSANGDQLAGTLERRLEGVNGPSHGPQRLTGRRLQR